MYQIRGMANLVPRVRVGTLGTRLRYGQYLTHAQNHNPDEPQ